MKNMLSKKKNGLCLALALLLAAAQGSSSLAASLFPEKISAE